MLFELTCWAKRLYRHGPRFRSELRRLEASARFPATRLAQYQDQQLQKLVAHCYRSVPYYRELFTRLKLAPEDLRGRRDLARLPFLDKQAVKDNYDRLIARGPSKLFGRSATTSGSTGTPARFLRDYNAINFENAALWRQWRAVGDHGKKRITLRGDIIVPASQRQPPFWKYNPANRELLMSGYHLSPANSAAYVERILEFQPRVLYAYPSTALLLAGFFEQQPARYRLDAIFTSSETLEPAVRARIESVFQCPISDWYGQAERVAAIAQCRLGSYHIQEDYSLVETLDGAQGLELVGTQLFNFVMPLLRYRTRDHVELAGAACACGSAFRTVARVVGRHYGYLVTPEGQRISITNHIPRGVENLIETQFCQERPGELIVNVLTNGRFSERDRRLLIRNTLEHTSPSMRVIVREVAEIPRGPNGKFVAIVNKLDALKDAA
jgi:phenylacetate-CoA ligase